MYTKEFNGNEFIVKNDKNEIVFKMSFNNEYEHVCVETRMSVYDGPIEFLEVI